VSDVRCAHRARARQAHRAQCNISCWVASHDCKHAALKENYIIFKIQIGNADRRLVSNILFYEYCIEEECILFSLRARIKRQINLFQCNHERLTKNNYHLRVYTYHHNG